MFHKIAKENTNKLKSVFRIQEALFDPDLLLLRGRKLTSSDGPLIHPEVIFSQKLTEGVSKIFAREEK